jgi:hypothetical protein
MFSFMMPLRGWAGIERYQTRRRVAINQLLPEET